jgi:hypothetical protein
MDKICLKMDNFTISFKEKFWNCKGKKALASHSIRSSLSGAGIYPRSEGVCPKDQSIFRLIRTGHQGSLGFRHFAVLAFEGASR